MAQITKTSTYETEKTNLKQYTPYTLPDNPSDQGWSSQAIKKKLYAGFFYLLDLLEAQRVLENNDIDKILAGTSIVKKAETDSNGNVITTYYATKTSVDNIISGTTIVGNATHSVNSDNATKSTKDANGNVIATTYETKSDAVTKKNNLQTSINNEISNRQSADATINQTISSMLTALGKAISGDTTSAQTIKGNLTINGDLTVLGSNSVIEATTLKVNDSLVVTNADGDIDNVGGLVGYVVRINEDDENNAYGIIYNEGVLELGKGTYDDGNFNFTDGENFPIALHGTIQDGNVPEWDGDSQIFKDSGVSISGMASAESTRQSNESIRQSQETTRQTNESTRQSNETTRTNNETARGVTFTNRITTLDQKLTAYESVNQSALAIVNKANRLLETLGFAEEESY